MLSRRIIFSCLLVCIVLGIFNNSTLAGPGSCQNFDFPRNPQNEVDWPQPVKVIKQDAPMYETATSSDPIKFLDFNKSLQVYDIQNSRIQIGSMASFEPLGWVERSNLLCAFSPLKSESGLEKKLYIKTATEVRKENFTLTERSLAKLREENLSENILVKLQDLKDQEYEDRELFINILEVTIGGDQISRYLSMILKHAEQKIKPTKVKAYSSPDLQGCSGEECRELSRFTGYFVFDEEENSYLLSESFRPTEMEKLVGWISKENGIIWDTAYGMRPHEELIFPEDHEKAGQERTICAYETIEDALTDRKCQPILGGDRWYMYADRIPILGRVVGGGKAFYKVALPLVGTGAEYNGNGNVVRIDPKLFVENRGINSLLYRKHVDVLFLIDGTKSMKPYIDAVKDDVVPKIINTLKNDEDFKETQFRFGFRIYRDTYAREKELGEGYPLPTSCMLSAEEKQQNLQGFYSMLDRVEEMRETGDDYPENLFGGIRQAIIDFAFCPDYTKILFVIGDCGYDAVAQERRGVTPVTMTSLVNKLKGSEEYSTTNIVTFFLQTPIIKDLIYQDPGSYEKAYNLFTKQARDILTQVLGAVDVVDNYLIETDDTNLFEKVLAGVKGFSHAGVINELELDLRGGAALTDAIERLRGSGKYHNLPGLFWEIIKQGSCQQLGYQCHERLYDTIFEGYIPVSEDVVEDVWMTSKDLNTWILILNSIGNMAGISGSELRETFTFALRDALEKVIRQPLYEDTGEPLAVYMQRKGGLPVRDTSPLFKYSIDDLKDLRVVPNCELSRLVTWISNVTEMMGIIRHGDLRPVYKKVPFPGECPSGEEIPFIDGAITNQTLGNDPKMRYDHQFQKAHIYWVPKEYLP